MVIYYKVCLGVPFEFIYFLNINKRNLSLNNLFFKQKYAINIFLLF